VPVTGLDTFANDLAAAREKAREAHRQAMITISTEVLEFLDRRSPVLTGAYRASHEISEGLGGKGPALYEHPDRPEPNEEVGVRTSPITPNRVGDAIRTLRTSLQPLTSLSLRNQRFYAAIIEFGSGSRAPRRLYGLGTDHGNAIAERIARQSEGGDLNILVGELRLG
jgi:hypothetical protein